MKAISIWAVMKFDMTHRSYLPSTGLPQPFNYRTTQPGSVASIIPAPGHSGGERQPYSEPSERIGYGRGVLVQNQPGELFVQGRITTRVAEELYL